LRINYLPNNQIKQVMALLATYDSVYRSKKGTPVCRYIVTGTAAEMKQFKKSQGEYFTEDPAKGVLYFSTTDHGDKVNLIINDAGNCYADNSEQLRMEMQVKQAGGNLGDALASELAKKIVSASSGSRNTTVNASDAAGIGSL